jgi:hypothetical protein|tara:strand:+ start:163 stop:612 length:450 start_codon:yes stop_codon:yes gene_type:complete
MATEPKMIDAIASSDEDYRGFFSSGIPAQISYGNRLYLQLADLTEIAVNKALQKHVDESRTKLERDEEYAPLAPYYDVRQVEDSDDLFEFGLYDVPRSHQPLAKALEFGANSVPPRAFLRRNLFKEAKTLSKDISRELNRLMGEVVTDD